MTQYYRTAKELIEPSLDQAKRYHQTGIQFVPMPVFSDEEAQRLSMDASKRLKQIEEAVTKGTSPKLNHFKA